MDLTSLIQNVFEINENIRYVAIADSKFQLIESKMRENTPTLTSEKIDAEFFSWVPPVMIEGVSKISSYVGAVTSITIQYEKVLTVYIPLKNYVIALGLDPAAQESVFKIANSVKTMVENAKVR